MKKLILILGVLSWLIASPAFAYTNANSTQVHGSPSIQLWSIADASATGMTFTTAVSFSTWVRFIDTATAMNVDLGMQTDFGSQRSYNFSYDGTTLNMAASSNGSTNTGKGVAWTTSTGTWYNVVVTYNAGTAIFYVNGAQQGATQSGLAATLFNSNTAITFANQENGAGTSGYLMNDTRMWSRVLSGSEVTSIYNSGAGSCSFSNGANLAGWWFIDNTGNDHSGNSNTLTGTNSPTFTTTLPYTCASAAKFNFWQFMDF